MNLEKRIAVFASLGKAMRSRVEQRDDSYETLCRQAYLKNNWFTKESIDSAMMAWSNVLTGEQITGWLKEYHIPGTFTGKKIGVINAGNIPLVGLHDFIAVLVSGHYYLGKNASEDNLLLPYIASLLAETSPDFQNQFQFIDRLTQFDAVIATGSNNSSRYFESYFSKVPHIIRKNRNGIALLDGNESKEDFEKLGTDIFQYFGLGCRNVSKLYVPQEYNFNSFFEAMYSFSEIMQHNKYMNNFDYNNAMLLMKQIPFLQNGFLIIREEERISSPISVVHYEKYSDIEQLAEILDKAEEQVQCVITKRELNLKSLLKDRVVDFGKAQFPALNDYADGVDTIEFLNTL